MAGVVALALAAGCKQDAKPGGGRAGSPAGAGPVSGQVELSIVYGSEKKTWLEEQIKVFTLGYRDEPNQAALGAIARAGAGTFARGDITTIVQIAAARARPGPARG